VQSNVVSTSRIVRLRSYWELDTGCLPAAAEEMIHVVTKMQRKSGNDARGAQWFQKHCGWDVTEDDDACGSFDSI